MARGITFITIGLVLDVLQAIIGLGLMGVTSAAGGILQFIPVVGTAAGAASAAGGAMAGYVTGSALSFGFGTFLVTLLTYSKMFYPRVMSVAYLGEILPVINFLPCWTALAARCTYLKHKEEKTAVSLNANAQLA